MNSEKILSFCIPTYNRSHLIEISINSILQSIKYFTENSNHKFEIVISDNNSTDSTERVVNNIIISNKLTNVEIIYRKNDSNIGAAKNFINLSNYANGEYIWFFSDDDYLIESAVSNFFNIYSLNYSFVFMTRILSDKELNIISEFKPQPNLENYDLTYPSGFLMLNKMGLEIANILGFYSSIIIKKDIWHNSKLVINDNTEFGHLKVLLNAIYDKSCYIIKEPGVICRLNYRGFTDMDSIVWLDEYVGAFSFAKKIGYDEVICNKMIKNIFRSYSRFFVLDKAKGGRHGNLFITKNELGYYEKYYDKWFFVSLFPAFMLARIFVIVDIIRKNK
ncbi:Glycosyltransferase involved in cell wall bisynthesis [Flavobacterium fluvii]|uniref:Glycosyltransferase involved in cell wall bisynthesis n=1 Tax=Flavobacterium fluvii TaxID=468056 RepID=A0A1M5IK91_9FLAO|nr:glycosyltransferase family 2 protein [Flavobacterium fluvii]SHG28697.1 Glycosyltransferase involved in cell wall bisynthesis [Flavobacterium fluvii]